MGTGDQIEEEVRLSEISCLRVLGFLLAYILEFLLIRVRGPSDS
jgi:hypothetical protein